MTPNPVSIRGSATIPEVLSFLTDTGYSAAPIIDETGRPIGVVSRTDVVVYERARVAAMVDAPVIPVGASGEAPVVRASDLMTPAVFSIAPETPGLRIAEEMVHLNVHRLFVVDRAGVLIGVISVLDLLRHLCEVLREPGGTW